MNQQHFDNSGTLPSTNKNEFLDRMKYRCYLPKCKTHHPSTCNFMYIKSDIAVSIWKELHVISIDDIYTMYNCKYNVYDQRNWHTFSTLE